MENGSFIDDLPVEKGDFFIYIYIAFHSYVKVPEGDFKASLKLSTQDKGMQHANILALGAWNFTSRSMKFWALPNPLSNWDSLVMAPKSPARLNIV